MNKFSLKNYHINLFVKDKNKLIKLNINIIYNEILSI
jgi:hypothetical protein